MQKIWETRVQSLGQEESPGGRHGNPLQYSCLENLMDREAWGATVHGVTKSQTGLKWLSMHTQVEPDHFCLSFELSLSGVVSPTLSSPPATQNSVLSLPSCTEPTFTKEVSPLNLFQGLAVSHAFLIPHNASHSRDEINVCWYCFLSYSDQFPSSYPIQNKSSKITLRC